MGRLRLSMCPRHVRLGTASPDPFHPQLQLSASALCTAALCQPSVPFRVVYSSTPAGAPPLQNLPCPPSFAGVHYGYEDDRYIDKLDQTWFQEEDNETCAKCMYELGDATRHLFPEEFTPPGEEEVHEVPMAMGGGPLRDRRKDGPAHFPPDGQGQAWVCIEHCFPACSALRGSTLCGWYIGYGDLLGSDRHLSCVLPLQLYRKN